jgi:hypothetical protein
MSVRYWVELEEAASRVVIRGVCMTPGCARLPRFEFDRLGRTVETCDCGYRGEQRPNATEVPREPQNTVPPVVRPIREGSKRCVSCLTEKDVSCFYGYERRCKTCRCAQVKRSSDKKKWAQMNVRREEEL